MSVDPIDNSKLVTLFVAESGIAGPAFATPHAHHLGYSFTDVDLGDGFSAWESEYSPARSHIEVHSSCAPISGGYSQQALNRFLAKALLVHRPDLVIICGVAGCTLDLPRVSALFAIPCVLFLPDEQALSLTHDAHSLLWVESSLQNCIGVFGASLSDVGGAANLINNCVQSRESLPALVASLEPVPSSKKSFDYSVYEVCSRDHPLLIKMQEPDARHFAGLNNVLDVGCGAGLFLDILRRQGIDAVGVEQNASIAEYGRGMGLNIENSEALSYLRGGNTQFEGMYCSHFVEHLPIDAVHELIGLLAARLLDNGVLVLVFPDPESIRSQLLGFWRDPEHVRFYHPDLIISIATLMGFDVEWTSYQEQPHAVGYFPEFPEPLQSSDVVHPEASPNGRGATGFFEGILERIGLVSVGRVRELESRFAQVVEKLDAQSEGHAAVLAQLADRTERLWEVNRTWAWNDNVTIKLRKRHRAV